MLKILLNGTAIHPLYFIKQFFKFLFTKVNLEFKKLNALYKMFLDMPYIIFKLQSLPFPEFKLLKFKMDFIQLLVHLIIQS